MTTLLGTSAVFNGRLRSVHVICWSLFVAPPPLPRTLLTHPPNTPNYDGTLAVFFWWPLMTREVTGSTDSADRAALVRAAKCRYPNAVGPTLNPRVTVEGEGASHPLGQSGCHATSECFVWGFGGMVWAIMDCLCIPPCIRVHFLTLSRVRGIPPVGVLGVWRTSS